jgi:hypothetical protein
VPDRSALDPAFEREKWEADVRLRERELAIRAAEQLTHDREAQSAIKAQERSRWANPLVLALLAAAFAAAGNAAVAWINGSAQRTLESERNKAQADLERYKADAQNSIEETKAESARILEMIKTADSDKAAVNLGFLLESGLIANPQRREALATFLSHRPPGQGPSLPSAGAVPPRSADMLPVISPTTKCKMKDSLTKSLFVSQFEASVESFNGAIVTKPTPPDYAPDNDEEIDLFVGIGGNKSRIDIHFDLSNRLVWSDVFQYPDSTDTDEALLSNYSDATDKKEVLAALARRALRGLVADPSCVQKPRIVIMKPKQ